MSGQVLRIKIAIACPGLGRHPRQMTDYISQGISRRGKARDFNLSLACLPVPDESVAPARRRSGSEINVVRALRRSRLPSRLWRRFRFNGRLTGNKRIRVDNALLELPYQRNETFRNGPRVSLVCRSRLDFALEQNRECESRKQAKPRSLRPICHASPFNRRR